MSEYIYYGNQANRQNIIMPYEDQRVLYRSDTHAPLSVVSQRYQEVQPMEILNFYKDLTEQSGFELETAGVLKGGRKFWALATTGQSTALKGKDVSNGYILLATACDGTLATTAQFTSVRVVCNNTLAIALRGQNSSRCLPAQVSCITNNSNNTICISGTTGNHFSRRNCTTCR